MTSGLGEAIEDVDLEGCVIGQLQDAVSFVQLPEEMVEGKRLSRRIARSKREKTFKTGQYGCFVCKFIKLKTRLPRGKPYDVLVAIA